MACMQGKCAGVPAGATPSHAPLETPQPSAGHEAAGHQPAPAPPPGLFCPSSWPALVGTGNCNSQRAEAGFCR
eukprot:364726-Chlamydomonas_euryale.AAC.4